MMSRSFPQTPIDATQIKREQTISGQHDYLWRDIEKPLPDPFTQGLLLHRQYFLSTVSKIEYRRNDQNFKDQHIKDYNWGNIYDENGIFSMQSVVEVVFEITKELTTRMRFDSKCSNDFLLPFRTELDYDSVYFFIDKIFQNGKPALQRNELIKLIKSINEYILSTILKWIWSRIDGTGSILPWNIYNIFVAKEHERNYRLSSFMEIMPFCFTNVPHASIVFDFFELLMGLILKINSSINETLKVIKLFGIWLLPLSSGSEIHKRHTLEYGNNVLNQTTRAILHLFFALLRSLRESIRLPKPLNDLLRNHASYPPKVFYNPQSSPGSPSLVVPFQAHLVTIETTPSSSLSKTPKVLLVKAAKLASKKQLNEAKINGNECLSYLLNDSETVMKKISRDSYKIFKRLERCMKKKGLIGYNGLSWTSVSQIETSGSNPNNINTQQGPRIILSSILVDDFIFWAWMSILSPEQADSKKTIFGKCVIVDVGGDRNELAIIEEKIVDILETDPQPTSISSSSEFVQDSNIGKQSKQLLGVSNESRKRDRVLSGPRPMNNNSSPDRKRQVKSSPLKPLTTREILNNALESSSNSQEVSLIPDHASSISPTSENHSSTPKPNNIKIQKEKEKINSSPPKLASTRSLLPYDNNKSSKQFSPSIFDRFERQHNNNQYLESKGFQFPLKNDINLENCEEESRRFTDILKEKELINRKDRPFPRLEYDLRKTGNVNHIVVKLPSIRKPKKNTQDSNDNHDDEDKSDDEMIRDFNVDSDGESIMDDIPIIEPFEGETAEVFRARSIKILSGKGYKLSTRRRKKLQDIPEREEEQPSKSDAKASSKGVTFELFPPPPKIQPRKLSQSPNPSIESLKESSSSIASKDKELPKLPPKLKAPDLTAPPPSRSSLSPSSSPRSRRRLVSGPRPDLRPASESPTRNSHLRSISESPFNNSFLSLSPSDKPEEKKFQNAFSLPKLVGPRSVSTSSIDTTNLKPTDYNNKSKLSHAIDNKSIEEVDVNSSSPLSREEKKKRRRTLPSPSPLRTESPITSNKPPPPIHKILKSKELPTTPIPKSSFLSTSDFLKSTEESITKSNDVSIDISDTSSIDDESIAILDEQSLPLTNEKYEKKDFKPLKSEQSLSPILISPTQDYLIPSDSESTKEDATPISKSRSDLTITDVKLSKNYSVPRLVNNQQKSRSPSPMSRGYRKALPAMPQSPNKDNINDSQISIVKIDKNKAQSNTVVLGIEEVQIKTKNPKLNINKNDTKEQLHVVNFSKDDLEKNDSSSSSSSPSPSPSPERKSRQILNTGLSPIQRDKPLPKIPHELADHYQETKRSKLLESGANLDMSSSNKAITVEEQPQKANVSSTDDISEKKVIYVEDEQKEKIDIDTYSVISSDSDYNSDVTSLRGTPQSLKKEVSQRLKQRNPIILSYDEESSEEEEYSIIQSTNQIFSDKTPEPTPIPSIHIAENKLNKYSEEDQSPGMNENFINERAMLKDNNYSFNYGDDSYNSKSSLLSPRLQSRDREQSSTSSLKDLSKSQNSVSYTTNEDNDINSYKDPSQIYNKNITTRKKVYGSSSMRSTEMLSENHSQADSYNNYNRDDNVKPALAQTLTKDEIKPIVSRDKRGHNQISSDGGVNLQGPFKSPDRYNPQVPEPISMSSNVSETSSPIKLEEISHSSLSMDGISNVREEESNRMDESYRSGFSSLQATPRALKKENDSSIYFDDFLSSPNSFTPSPMVSNNEECYESPNNSDRYNRHKVPGPISMPSIHVAQRSSPRKNNDDSEYSQSPNNSERYNRHKVPGPISMPSIHVAQRSSPINNNDDSEYSQSPNNSDRYNHHQVPEPISMSSNVSRRSSPIKLEEISYSDLSMAGISDEREKEPNRMDESYRSEFSSLQGTPRSLKKEDSSFYFGDSSFNPNSSTPSPIMSNNIDHFQSPNNSDRYNRHKVPGPISMPSIHVAQRSSPRKNNDDSEYSQSPNNSERYNRHKVPGPISMPSIHIAQKSRPKSKLQSDSNNETNLVESLRQTENSEYNLSQLASIEGSPPALGNERGFGTSGSPISAHNSNISQASFRGDDRSNLDFDPDYEYYNERPIPMSNYQNDGPRSHQRDDHSSRSDINRNVLPSNGDHMYDMDDEVYVLGVMPTEEKLSPIKIESQENGFSSLKDQEYSSLETEDINKYNYQQKVNQKEMNSPKNIEASRLRQDDNMPGFDHENAPDDYHITSENRLEIQIDHLNTSDNARKKRNRSSITPIQMPSISRRISPKKVISDTKTATLSPDEQTTTSSFDIKIPEGFNIPIDPFDSEYVSGSPIRQRAQSNALSNISSKNSKDSNAYERQFPEKLDIPNIEEEEEFVYYNDGDVPKIIFDSNLYSSTNNKSPKPSSNQSIADYENSGHSIVNDDYIHPDKSRNITQQTYSSSDSSARLSLGTDPSSASTNDFDEIHLRSVKPKIQQEKMKKKPIKNEPPEAEIDPELAIRLKQRRRISDNFFGRFESLPTGFSKTQNSHDLDTSIRPLNMKAGSGKNTPIATGRNSPIQEMENLEPSVLDENNSVKVERTASGFDYLKDLVDEAAFNIDELHIDSRYSMMDVSEYDITGDPPISNSGTFKLEEPVTLKVKSSEEEMVKREFEGDDRYFDKTGSYNYDIEGHSEYLKYEPDQPQNNYGEYPIDPIPFEPDHGRRNSRQLGFNASEERYVNDDNHIGINNISDNSFHSKNIAQNGIGLREHKSNINNNTVKIEPLGNYVNVNKFEESIDKNDMNTTNSLVYYDHDHKNETASNFIGLYQASADGELNKVDDQDLYNSGVRSQTTIYDDFTYDSNGQVISHNPGYTADKTNYNGDHGDIEGKYEMSSVDGLNSSQQDRQGYDNSMPPSKPHMRTTTSIAPDLSPEGIDYHVRNTVEDWYQDPDGGISTGSNGEEELQIPLSQQDKLRYDGSMRPSKPYTSAAPDLSPDGIDHHIINTVEDWHQDPEDEINIGGHIVNKEKFKIPTDNQQNRQGYHDSIPPSKPHIRTTKSIAPDLSPGGIDYHVRNTVEDFHQDPDDEISIDDDISNNEKSKILSNNQQTKERIRSNGVSNYSSTPMRNNITHKSKPITVPDLMSRSANNRKLFERDQHYKDGSTLPKSSNRQSISPQRKSRTSSPKRVSISRLEDPVSSMFEEPISTNREVVTTPNNNISKSRKSNSNDKTHLYSLNTNIDVLNDNATEHTDQNPEMPKIELHKKQYVDEETEFGHEALENGENQSVDIVDLEVSGYKPTVTNKHMGVADNGIEAESIPLTNKKVEVCDREVGQVSAPQKIVHCDEGIATDKQLLYTVLNVDNPIDKNMPLPQPNNVFSESLPSRNSSATNLRLSPIITAGETISNASSSSSPIRTVSPGRFSLNSVAKTDSNSSTTSKLPKRFSPKRPTIRPRASFAPSVQSDSKASTFSYTPSQPGMGSPTISPTESNSSLFSPAALSTPPPMMYPQAMASPQPQFQPPPFYGQPTYSSPLSQMPLYPPLMGNMNMPGGFPQPQQSSFIPMTPSMHSMPMHMGMQPMQYGSQPQLTSMPMGIQFPNPYGNNPTPQSFSSNFQPMNSNLNFPGNINDGRNSTTHTKNTRSSNQGERRHRHHR